jgi:2-haloacid dehalogenase
LPFRCSDIDTNFVATFFHVLLIRDYLKTNTEKKVVASCSNQWPVRRGGQVGNTVSSGLMVQIHAVVFDAYGTLLDVHAAMARHSGRLGSNWPQISADWRQKQLEYSWVRSLAGSGHHRDFWHLTDAALAWAAARHGVSDEAVLGDVLTAYRTLDAYPEVPTVLKQLRDRGLATAILSNGEPGMLADATRSAGIDALLDHVLSVETVNVFKPDPAVYRLAEQRLGLVGGQVAFVSSNPWDAFGAHAFGFQVFWINRTGQPHEYDLHQNAAELTGLAALPDALDARGPG